MSASVSSTASPMILVDGSSYLYRAFHAIPPLNTSDGQPTNAIRGVISMIRSLMGRFPESPMVVIFDAKGKTFRDEIYSEYKAQRPSMPDELRLQIEPIHSIIKAMGLPLISISGVEADDVIGTLAVSLKNTYGIIIASGDMDTLQLVDGTKVQVFTLRKGINDTILYDERAVVGRFGFKPEHIVDYKGLAGDPSDNIIGIQGIGEKTATTLIQTYGSVETIYKKALKSLDDFKKRTGLTERIFNLLKDNQEEAEFSKVLATIRKDVPVAFEAEAAHWKKNFSATDAVGLFTEMGFRSLIPRMQALAQGMQKKTETETPPPLEQEPVSPPSATHEENQDSPLFKECAVMVWLLHSDTTNPSLEDVLNATGASSLTEAHTTLVSELKKEKLLAVYEKIEQPLIPVIDTLNTNGILIDTAYLATLSKEYHIELDKLAKKIFKKAGQEFNINSPKQLGEVLFVHMGIKQARQKKTATGQLSTKESELLKLKDEHPVIADILAYRELQKLLSTYIDAIPPLLAGDARLHTTFIQTGTTTGRLSSRDPNLQNIPIKSDLGRRIRRAFIAEKGTTLVAFDYSQIELRLAAFLSGDEKLKEIFSRGEDVHTAVAAEVFGVAPQDVAYEMRRRAKVINFGILYGMGVNALRAQLGTERAEAQDFMNRYFETFTGLANYLTKTKAVATRVGYTATFFGRKRFFPGLKSKLPFVRASAERMAINAPIQGTQADIIKLAMVRIHKNIQDHFEGRAKMVLQIHDELVFEVDEKYVAPFAKETKQIMESILTVKETQGVPITVSSEAGPSWGEMKVL